MSRNPNTVMEPGVAWAAGRDVVMVDVTNGGQFGYAPDVGSFNSATPYVRRHLIAILLEGPRILDVLPQSESTAWYAGLKALIETRPKSWEGFNMQLQPEFASTPFGGGGEEIETVSDMKRTRSNPTATYVDNYGRPVATFWEQYALQFMMDPQSKVPQILNRTDLPAGTVLDFLPDMVSFTVLFFEPNPTYTKVDKAWLMANMMPKTMPPVEGHRDLTSPMDMTEFPIEFTHVAQVGEGVNQLAQSILDTITLTGANPNMRAAFVSAIDPNVQASLTGYKESVDAIAQAATSV